MHINSPQCPSCQQKLIGITNSTLLSFVDSFRQANPDAHISCGLRGEAEQEADFDKGVSKAHFGQSAHNYGLAVDWFRLTQSNGAAFDPIWFRNILGPAVALSPPLTWGGTFKSIIDLPHVEVTAWRQLSSK